MAKYYCFYQIFPDLSQLKDLIPSQDQVSASRQVNCGPCLCVKRLPGGVTCGLGTCTRPAPPSRENPGAGRTRALRAQPVAMQQGWPVASRVPVARKERQTYAKRFRKYEVTERTLVYRLVRLHRAGRQTQPQRDSPTDFCFLPLTPGTPDGLSSQTSDGLGLPVAVLGEPRGCFPLQPGRPAARGATLQPR